MCESVERGCELSVKVWSVDVLLGCRLGWAGGWVTA